MQQNQIVPVKSVIKETRFQYSIAREPYSLSVFGEDEKLVKQFIFWLSHKINIDFFGSIRIDVKTFAKDMGYKTVSHLQKKVDGVPEQLKGLTEREILSLRAKNVHIFESVFDNMIYKLGNILMKLYHKTENANQEIQTHRSDVLIKQIKAFIDKKNRNKVYFDLFPSDFYFENLSKAFLMLNYDSFSQLALSKTPKIEDLYLSLAAARNYNKIKQAEHVLLPFDHASRVLGIDSWSEPRFKKQHIKKCLEILRQKATDLNFEYAFVPNGRWNYRIQLRFLENKAYTQEERANFRIELFDSCLYSLLYQKFEKLYPEKASELFDQEFKNWVRDSTKDRDQKIVTYCKAHELTWAGKKIDKNAPQIHYWLENQSFMIDPKDYPQLLN